jgi:hypothetical protein
MGESFTGMCVGGPMAGKFLAHHSPVYKVMEQGKVHAMLSRNNLATDMMTVTSTQYFHEAEGIVTPQGTTAFWRHESIPTTEDCVMVIIGFYSKRK